MTDHAAAVSRPRAILAATRPPFLILAPVTVLLGVATALHSGAVIEWHYLLAALVGALSAHVAVNTLNEYQDFRSGLDALTQRTPFSGGSGALPARPDGARGVWWTTVAAIALTVAIGLYLAWARGPVIVLIGVAGLALILSYTRWLNRDPWLSLLAPGLGFGPLMVLGTQVAMGAAPDLAAWLAALISLCLASNLLLLNQYPDRDADRAVGRRTFPIVYGIAASGRVYGALLTVAALLLVGGVLLGRLPPTTLVALLPLLGGVAAWRIARRYQGDNSQLLPALGLNVAAAIFTPLLLGIALLVAVQ